MANSNFLYYKIIVEAKSPVFVGSGLEISKKDCLYVKSEKSVYVLDGIKVFEGMKRFKLLGEYEHFLMDEGQKNFAFFTKEHSLPLNECKKWASYKLPLDDINEEVSRSKGGGSDNIMAFIKDVYGCPYVPGSSLKGAIRTAIQNMLVEQRKGELSSVKNDVEREEFFSRNKYLKKADSKTKTTLFHTLKRNEKQNDNAVNDVFSGFRIGDSEPLKISDLSLCQKIDVYTDGKEKRLPLKRECIKPGTKIVFPLEIDLSCLEYNKEFVYEALDKSYNIYFKSFLSAYKPIGNEKENVKEHMVYLGGGAGFATKTSVYALFDNRSSAVKAVQKIMIKTTSTKKDGDKHKHKDDYEKHNVSPHMRKCTRYNGKLYDMGLCKVTIEERNSIK